MQGSDFLIGKTIAKENNVRERYIVHYSKL
jgi:hypothetical protein